MKRTGKGKGSGEKVLELKSANEVRLLVSSYYAAQEMRKRLDMQVRHMGAKGDLRADEEGHAALPPFLSTVGDSWSEIEVAMRGALEKYAKSSKVGCWALSQLGVGPVITAGLLAHLDIERAPSAGHFWSFAGLNPNMKWEKGQKRPYNAELKQITYHLGECFKRTSKHPRRILREYLCEAEGSARSA